MLHYDNQKSEWQIFTDYHYNIECAYCTIRANEVYHLDVYFKNNNYSFYCNGIPLCNIPFSKPTSIVICDDSNSTEWYKTGWWQDCGIFCDIEENELGLKNRGDNIILPTWFYYSFPTYSINHSLYGIKK